MEDKKEIYPEGHFVGMWIGIGIAIFTGVGVAISFALENPGMIGVGPAIGVAFGAGVGSSIESRYKKEGKIRPLTEDEKKRKRYLIIVGIVLFLVGLLTLLLFSFL